MDKITDEMRSKLREPLPPEAVSQHPTKTYLSSIKSIYVVERINDVFGLGTWTLKSEVVERLEKFAVVKAILEIPGVGFYGEAYGGNDNIDIGDAYKGATTDGLTKIAAQQLEIGIDVFKGIKPKPARQATKSTTSPVEKQSKGKVSKEEQPNVEQAEKDAKNMWPPDPIHAEEATIKTKKPKRDPDTIQTFTELYKACSEDFTISDKDGKPKKMQPYQVIAELGYKSQSDITELPSECYIQMRAAREVVS